MANNNIDINTNVKSSPVAISTIIVVVIITVIIIKKNLFYVHWSFERKQESTSFIEFQNGIDS